MIKRILVVAVVFASLLLSNPRDARGVFNQDPFPVDPFGIGAPMCNDCVISISQGYKCMPEFNGYTGCASGWVYTFDPVTGQRKGTPFCSIQAYSACFTQLP